MQLHPLSSLPPLPPLRLAVVGHIEWVSFIGVERLPAAGSISHANTFLEEPAGGGAVVAVQLARLTGQRVSFFTALGRDAIGRQSADRLPPWVWICRWPGGMAPAAAASVWSMAAASARSP